MFCFRESFQRIHNRPKNCIIYQSQIRYRGVQKRENRNKNVANLSIKLSERNSDLSYIDMDGLANLVDKPSDPNNDAAIARDAKEYKPIRDAIAHTALLTELAIFWLTSTYKNIKARVKKILEE